MWDFYDSECENIAIFRGELDLSAKSHEDFFKDANGESIEW